MKNVLVLLVMSCVLCGFGSVVHGLAIDNTNSDWYAEGLVKSDPVGDHGHDPTDLLAWGATMQVDDGVRYLYVYFEDDGLVGAAMSGGSVFAGTMIDVDRRSGGAFEGPLPVGGGARWGWNGASALGHDFDNGGPEFMGGPEGGCFDGYDAFSEWSPNNGGFNFWGNPSDDVWQQGSAITTATISYGTNFIEHKIPVSTIIAEVMAGVDYNSSDPERVRIGSCWLVGVRLAEHVEGTNWEGDKSGDAADPDGGVYDVFVPVPILPGDANEDGVVNFSDYLSFSTGFGQTFAKGTCGNCCCGWSMGDFNCDGVVNFSDYLGISSNFGATLGGQIAGVPEPISLLLFLVPGALIARFRLGKK